MEKNMTNSWVTIIKDEYALTDEQCEEMTKKEMESQNIILLNMKNVSNLNREPSVLFACQFDEIDEETSKQILNVLRNRNRGN